jgi:hypothetical protein
MPSRTNFLRCGFLCELFKLFSSFEQLRENAQSGNVGWRCLKVSASLRPYAGFGRRGFKRHQHFHSNCVEQRIRNRECVVRLQLSYTLRDAVFRSIVRSPCFPRKFERGLQVTACKVPSKSSTQPSRDT